MVELHILLRYRYYKKFIKMGKPKLIIIGLVFLIKVRHLHV